MKLNAQAQPGIKLDQLVVERGKLGYWWRWAGTPGRRAGRLWPTGEQRTQLKGTQIGSKDQEGI